MMANIIFVVLLSCLFQSIGASTIDEVIAEMQPKIDAAADHISGITTRSGNNINNNHVSIDNLVRTGTTTVYTKLENLDKIVLDAIIEKGNAIEECVANEKVEADGVSIYPLQLCRNSDKWELLGIQLSNLSILQLLVVSSVSNCIATGVNPDSVRTCIQTVIDDSLHQAEVIEKFVQTTLTEVRSTAIKCVNDNAVAISVQIDTIIRNFTKCVESN